jgi:hypothetical protein
MGFSLVCLLFVGDVFGEGEGGGSLSAGGGWREGGSYGATKPRSHGWLGLARADALG